MYCHIRLLQRLFQKSVKYVKGLIMSKLDTYKFKELSLIHVIHLSTAIPEITMVVIILKFFQTFLSVWIILAQHFSVFFTYVILTYLRRTRSFVACNHLSSPHTWACIPLFAFTIPLVIPHLYIHLSSQPCTVTPKWQRPFLIQIYIFKDQHLEDIQELFSEGRT